MKLPIRFLLSLISTGLLCACQPATDTPVNDTTISTKTISFIHLNDLHAHLVPHKEYEYRNGQALIKHKGGLARIATAIKQLRIENPNSILMNIGDT